MAQTILAKIKEVREVPAANVVKITVEYKDANGYTWEKEYNHNGTEDLKLVRFKQTLLDDLKVDLKPKTTIAEIKKAIGQDFSLIV